MFGLSTKSRMMVLHLKGCSNLQASEGSDTNLRGCEGRGCYLTLLPIGKGLRLLSHNLHLLVVHTATAWGQGPLRGMLFAVASLCSKRVWTERWYWGKAEYRAMLLTPTNLDPIVCAILVTRQAGLGQGFVWRGWCSRRLGWSVGDHCRRQGLINWGLERVCPTWISQWPGLIRLPWYTSGPSPRPIVKGSSLYFLNSLHHR